MIYIVEIKDKSGGFARKEYHAPNLHEAVQMARVDIMLYPRLRIHDVWPADDERPRRD